MGLPWPSGAWPASMPAIPAQAYLHAACWKGAATPRPTRKQNSGIGGVRSFMKSLKSRLVLCCGPVRPPLPAGRVEAPEEREIPAGCRVRRVRPWMAYCAVPSLQVPERGYPEPRRRANGQGEPHRPAAKDHTPISSPHMPNHKAKPAFYNPFKLPRPAQRAAFYNCRSIANADPALPTSYWSASNRKTARCHPPNPTPHPSANCRTCGGS